MEYEFQHYFHKLKEKEAILAQNPFSNSLDVSDISDEMQEQFIELKNDSTARDIYHEKSPSQIWCDISESYPQISKHAFQTLLSLLFTRPLPRDGGMAEDHGAPEAGKLPRVWTRGHRETESRQRVSGAKSP